MGIRDLEAGTPARIWLKFAIDLAIWSLAALLAFPLRLDDPLSVPLESFLLYMFIGLFVRGAAIWWAGLPRQAWRHARTVR